MTNEIFMDIPCLTEGIPPISVEKLRQRWFKKSDKRYLGQTIQKFIDFNRKSFDFLEIEAKVIGTDKQTMITFKTNKYTGAVPLRSPDTGKQIGDFLVSPRFYNTNNKFSSLTKLLLLLETSIRPQFFDSIPLSSGDIVKPPLYYEAAKYIESFDKALKSHWRKFKNVSMIRAYPKSTTNWDKYAKNAYDPIKLLEFPCEDNILSVEHCEFSKLRYVFDIARAEIMSASTPSDIRHRLIEKIDTILQNLKGINVTKCRQLTIHFSDPLVIKEAKKQANILLEQGFSHSYGWRIDVSELFERYIQFIIEKCANVMFAQVYKNIKISKVKGHLPSWGLSYLEPDILLKKGDRTIVVDAKYKSHYYNMNNSSEQLKMSHREDLHQLLAYCSFDTSNNKIGAIFYPANEISFRELEYKNALSASINKVIYFGLPFDADQIEPIKELVRKKLECVIKNV